MISLTKKRSVVLNISPQAKDFRSFQWLVKIEHLVYNSVGINCESAALYGSHGSGDATSTSGCSGLCCGCGCCCWGVGLVNNVLCLHHHRQEGRTRVLRRGGTPESKPVLSLQWGTMPLFLVISVRLRFPGLCWAGVGRTTLTDKSSNTEQFVWEQSDRFAVHLLSLDLGPDPTLKYEKDIHRH